MDLIALFSALAALISGSGVTADNLTNKTGR
jgi:hypothetical protein